MKLQWRPERPKYYSLTLLNLLILTDRAFPGCGDFLPPQPHLILAKVGSGWDSTDLGCPSPDAGEVSIQVHGLRSNLIDTRSDRGRVSMVLNVSASINRRVTVAQQ